MEQGYPAKAFSLVAYFLSFLFIASHECLENIFECAFILITFSSTSTPNGSTSISIIQVQFRLFYQRP
jgi:hypothetical protein